MFSKINFNKYEVEEIIPNVFYIQNFLNDLELNELNTFINSLSQDDWEFEYKESLKKFCLEKFNTDDVESLVKEGKFEVTQNWNDKNVSLHNEKTQWVADEIWIRMTEIINGVDQTLIQKGPGIIQRQQPGVSLTAHYDQYTDPSIFFASIIYINDDYNGGELFFSNKNFKIKPKAKSLLVFPGNEEFTHGVYAVENGPTRYVLPGFIAKKDFYKENKY